MRTRVKFCGVTSADDARAAAAAGADAVGLVFYPPAKVAVPADAAAAITAALPPFVTAVALFVDAAADEVRQVIATAKPQLLQFHGDEQADYCLQFGLPYLKACRVRAAADIARAAAAHPRAAGLLLDAYVEGQPGGTGRGFDWAHIPAQRPLPLVAAGGLHADNVGDLVRAARPWGVDVSSGVADDNDRRRKNWDKMTGFIRSVRDADDD